MFVRYIFLYLRWYSRIFPYFLGRKLSKLRDLTQLNGNVIFGEQAFKPPCVYNGDASYCKTPPLSYLGNRLRRRTHSLEETCISTLGSGWSLHRLANSKTGFDRKKKRALWAPWLAIAIMRAFSFFPRFCSAYVFYQAMIGYESLLALFSNIRISCVGKRKKHNCSQSATPFQQLPNRPHLLQKGPA